MLLGVKVDRALFSSSDKYREQLNNFDVWYSDPGSYYKGELPTFDNIYKLAHELGKEMYGYFLFSSRWCIPEYKSLSVSSIIERAEHFIKRYPLIEKWELCHEGIDDNGKIRRDNVYVKEFGIKWQEMVYMVIKNKYPHKKFYYSDYIRTTKKAHAVVDFVNTNKYIDGFNFQIHSDIVNPLSFKLVEYVLNNINKDVICLETVIWSIKKTTFNDVALAKKPKQLLRNIIKKGSYHLLSIAPNTSQHIQANRYKKYKQICKKSGVSIFGIWSLTDNSSDVWCLLPWQEKPGLLNEDFTEKLCYKSIFS